MAKQSSTSASSKAAATTATVRAGPTGKLGILVALLQRPEGASLAQLTEGTGWQAHSVRGAIAGALKKHGFKITSEKVDDTRIYRASPGAEA